MLYSVYKKTIFCRKIPRREGFPTIALDWVDIDLPGYRMLLCDPCLTINSDAQHGKNVEFQ